MILVLILTFKADMITAIAKEDLKMVRSEQDSNPDLCDACTVDIVIYLPVELPAQLAKGYYASS